MRSAYYQPSSERRRATAFLLALIAHILIVLLLLRLTPVLPPPLSPPKPPVTFQMLPGAEDAAKPPAKAKAVVRDKQASSRAAPRARTATTTPPATVPVPPPVPAAVEPKLLVLSRNDFDAADIAKIPSRPSDGDADGEGTTGTASGRNSGSVYGPGEGPGGQRLYNAEWYREPTNAELSFYLPRAVPPGSWTEIACRTIERYHVDNCRPLGESPIGSGLGRAMRQAAWQFLVRPPRIGGRAMVGEWVRIRIDFTEQGEARAGRR